MSYPGYDITCGIRILRTDCYCNRCGGTADISCKITYGSKHNSYPRTYCYDCFTNTFEMNETVEKLGGEKRVVR